MEGTEQGYRIFQSWAHPHNFRPDSGWYRFSASVGGENTLDRQDAGGLLFQGQTDNVLFSADNQSADQPYHYFDPLAY
jgi:hypothetical protein